GGKGTSEVNENNPNPTPRVRQGMDYGEHEDVQKVHAAIQREKGEPRVGLEPLSIWLIAIYGLAVFFGGAYLGRYSGNFNGDGLDPLGGPPPTKKQGAAGPGGGEQTELSPADRGKNLPIIQLRLRNPISKLSRPTQICPAANPKLAKQMRHRKAVPRPPLPLRPSCSRGS